ncbi:MAG: hypothetical protein ACOYOF_13020 [Verrucomicrobiaceae bacterium]
MKTTLFNELWNSVFEALIRAAPTTENTMLKAIRTTPIHASDLPFDKLAAEAGSDE